MESPRERLLRENQETMLELKLVSPKEKKKAIEIEKEILTKWFHSCERGHRCKACLTEKECDRLRKDLKLQSWCESLATAR